MVDFAKIVLGWPVDASTPITQLFGENPSDYARFGLAGHNGVDFGCPLGTPICAAASGTIMAAGNDPTGYGNYIKIAHGDYQTLYGHMSQLIKKTGQVIVKGDVIGYSGSTGNSSGPHLHFELRIPGHGVTGFKDAVDPFPYMEAVPSTHPIASSECTGSGSDEEVTSDQVTSPSTSSGTVKVTAEEGLNVRLTPGGVDVGDLRFGSELEVVRQEGDWVGVVLWVHKGYVSSV